VFSINRGLADAAYIFSPPRAVCFCAVMRGVEFHVVKKTDAEKAKRHHKAGLGQWDLVRSIQFQPQPERVTDFSKTNYMHITCALGAVREAVG
jgi:hypothetical protein